MLGIVFNIGNKHPYMVMYSIFGINTPVRGKIELYNDHPVGGGGDAHLTLWGLNL